MALAENPLRSSRSKHVDVRFHFFGEPLRAKKIGIQFVASEEQHAIFLRNPMSCDPCQISPYVFVEPTVGA